jgi:hypothetical protein
LAHRERSGKNNQSCPSFPLRPPPDQAAPLVGWELPECCARLRRLLEARLSKGGKREYVQVLRLLETFSMQDVEGAILDALHLGTISFDAIKHLLLCRIERPAVQCAGYRNISVAELTVGVCLGPLLDLH